MKFSLIIFISILMALAQGLALPDLSSVINVAAAVLNYGTAETNHSNISSKSSSGEEVTTTTPVEDNTSNSNGAIVKPKSSTVTSTAVVTSVLTSMAGSTPTVSLASPVAKEALVSNRNTQTISPYHTFSYAQSASADNKQTQPTKVSAAVVGSDTNDFDEPIRINRNSQTYATNTFTTSYY